MLSLSFRIFKTRWFIFQESWLCLEMTNTERYCKGIWQLNWYWPYTSFTHFGSLLRWTISQTSYWRQKWSLQLATCMSSSIVSSGILYPTCKKVCSVCEGPIYKSSKNHNPSIHENLLINKAYMKILMCQDNQTINSTTVVHFFLRWYLNDHFG